MDLMLLLFQDPRMNNTRCLSNYTPITHCGSEEDADESSLCTGWNGDDCCARHLTETRLFFGQKAGCICGRWGKTTPSEAIRSPRFICVCFISPPHCWARGPSSRCFQRCSSLGCGRPFVSALSRQTRVAPWSRVNLPQHRTLTADVDEALRLWQFESLRGNCAVTLKCSETCLSTLSARSIKMYAIHCWRGCNILHIFHGHRRPLTAVIGSASENKHLLNYSHYGLHHSHCSSLWLVLFACLHAGWKDSKNNVDRQNETRKIPTSP